MKDEDEQPLKLNVSAAINISLSISLVEPRAATEGRPYKTPITFFVGVALCGHPFLVGERRYFHVLKKLRVLIVLDLAIF